MCRSVPTPGVNNSVFFVFDCSVLWRIDCILEWKGAMCNFCLFAAVCDYWEQKSNIENNNYQLSALPHLSALPAAW